jgi:putative PIN family toxin of toxin-antitoxin system
MKVVLDTNVLISALLGGRSQRVLDLWRAAAFEVIVSTEILSEYLAVIRRPKFKLPPSSIDDISRFLLRYSTSVTPTEPSVKAAADPKDDRFLDAALAGQADLIVSGDHHLLDLNPFHGISILTVREFLAQFPETDPKNPEDR